MKFILIIFVIATALAQAPDWKEKAKHMQEQYEEVRDVCTAKMDLTEKEIKEAEVLSNPTTRREKCILACLLEELGLMVDGKFSREKSDKVAEYLYDDNPENLALSKSISKTCEKAVEAAKLDDNCDVAGEIIKCVKAQAKLYTAKTHSDYED